MTFICNASREMANDLLHWWQCIKWPCYFKDSLEKANDLLHWWQCILWPCYVKLIISLCSHLSLLLWPLRPNGLNLYMLSTLLYNCIEFILFWTSVFGLFLCLLWICYSQIMCIDVANKSFRSEGFALTERDTYVVPWCAEDGRGWPNVCGPNEWDPNEWGPNEWASIS